MRTDPKTALRVLCDLRSRNALQHFTRATLYANLREKCRGPEPRTTLCASPRSRNACQDFTRATLLGAEMYRKIGAPQNEPRTQTHILCEPAQSIHMSKFHKSHFIQKFTGKMLQPRLSPERRHTFCASLHSRNALQRFTKDIRRATLHKNLQEKCRGPD